MKLQQTSITTFVWFRKIAYIEGWSYLLLLMIAMPLKYLAGMPMAVRIVGMIHGILFIALGILALLVLNQYNKGFLWLLKAFIASILPFGTFFMDREWKKEEKILH